MDALAAGISFVFLNVNIIDALSIIGVMTFLISFIGVKSGHFLGRNFKREAEIFGGFVLMIMGIEILFEHGVFLHF
ncbi:manganese efflux pump [Rodentibacter abscessus]